MSEVIVVTSGKGGVGKTTTTANIGTGLAKLGKKVVMIDTDTGLRNLDVVLGLENRIVYNLVDVVEGNCRLKQAMITDKRCPYLYLLPTAQTRDKSAISPEQMIKLVDEIKADPENFDYILLDCPAGIEQGFQNAQVLRGQRNHEHEQQRRLRVNAGEGEHKGALKRRHGDHAVQLGEHRGPGQQQAGQNAAQHPRQREHRHLKLAPGVFQRFARKVQKIDLQQCQYQRDRAAHRALRDEHKGDQPPDLAMQNGRAVQHQVVADV